MSAVPDRRRNQRGSVLAPVVAAMLILTISGTMLSELFASQRMSAVNAVESTQAYWAGEAGIWHAAYEQMSVPSPVTIGGASYVVTKSGEDYDVDAVRNNTTRELSADIPDTLRLITTGAPLHESASALTAYTHQADHFHLYLASVHADDSVISGFRLFSSRAVPELTELRLGSDQIWSDVSGSGVPTGIKSLNSGTTAERTVSANNTTDLMLTFEGDVTPGTIQFLLGVYFTDGTSSALFMTLDW